MMTALVVLLAIVASACGSDGPPATTPLNTECDADQQDCVGADSSDADDPLPSVVTLGDPNDPDAPLAITFGGFFYSDGTVSQLCSALAESFPPQCASVVIDIEAPLDVALGHVADAFGSSNDARINIDQGVYWTDDWVNLSGTLQANRLVLE